MKKIIGLTAGLLSLSLLAACSPKEKAMTSDGSQDKTSQVMSDKDQASKNNMPSLASDFQLQGVDGKTYRLADYKGKKVYLKFWASWCSICLSTLEDAEALAKASDKDYEVLTIVSPGHQGEKSEEAFKKWFAGTDFKDMPVLLDPDGKLLEAYGVRSYPTEIFIGSDGSYAKKHIGYAPKEAIERTLKDID